MKNKIAALILVIVFIVVLWSRTLIVAADFGLIDYSLALSLSGKWNVRGILCFLDVPAIEFAHDWSHRVHRTWHGLVWLAKDDPSALEILRIESFDPGARGTYANMALFRLRDSPDQRLANLLTRLETHRPLSTSAGTEWLAVEDFLELDLDPLVDRGYVEILSQHENSPDDRVREKIQAALSRFTGESDKVLSDLTDAVHSDLPDARIAAVDKIDELARQDIDFAMDPMPVSLLLALLLEDKDQAVQLSACRVLTLFGRTDESVEGLVQAYSENPSDQIRKAAISAICTIARFEESEDILLRAISDPMPGVRNEALSLLLRLYINRYGPFVLAFVVAIMVVLILRKSRRNRMPGTV